MKSFKVTELSNLLKGTLIGDTTMPIIAPEQIEVADVNHITFIGDKKYLSKWQHSKASAAIINKSLGDVSPGENKAFIMVENADLAMAKLLELFVPESTRFGVGTHPSAIVHETAILGSGTTIGAHCYIGANVKIGSETTIYPNTTILDNATIGNHNIIKSGTVIGERCIIGDHCIIHSNVSIGTDGFGYRPSDDGKRIIKIPHIGNVIIGHDVEIGSNSCIDRGKFSSTTIGDGTKIDNLVQIAHNCKIGRSCLIAGCTGIAGSVTLGDGVAIGGHVGIIDHLTIGHGAKIGACSAVLTDVPAGKSFLGYPAIESREMMKQWVTLKRLAQKESAKGKSTNQA